MKTILLASASLLLATGMAFAAGTVSQQSSVGSAANQNFGLSGGIYGSTVNTATTKFNTNVSSGSQSITGISGGSSFQTTGASSSDTGFATSFDTANSGGSFGTAFSTNSDVGHASPGAGFSASGNSFSQGFASLSTTATHVDKAGFSLNGYYNEASSNFSLKNTQVTGAAGPETLCTKDCTFESNNNDNNKLHLNLGN